MKKETFTRDCRFSYQRLGSSGKLSLQSILGMFVDLGVYEKCNNKQTNKHTNKQTFPRDLDNTPLLDKIMAMWKSRTYELQLL